MEVLRLLVPLLCIAIADASVQLESNALVEWGERTQTGCDPACKDTMDEAECKKMESGWGMCKQGGYNADQCKKTCKKCEPCTGGETPAPPSGGSPRRRSGGPGPGKGGETCKCAKSTSWDGSFPQYASGAKDFCDQGWGSSTPYVCAGGGSAGAAIPCSSEICTGGQYTFSAEEGWKILAKGGMPYRAFAFLKYCNGKKIGDCWKDEPVDFSFSFKTDDMLTMKSFVKLFFWTDNGNMLGLIGPTHSKSGGKYKLITFMGDDYPNKFQDEMVIEDQKWYHVQVTFTPSKKRASIMIDGKQFSEGEVPVAMLTDQNGPQLGAYVFGPGEMQLWINDICVGKHSGTCPSVFVPDGDGPPESGRRRKSSPSPTPAPPAGGRRRRKTSPSTPPPSGRRRKSSRRRRRRKSSRRRRKSQRRRR